MRFRSVPILITALAFGVLYLPLLIMLVYSFIDPLAGPGSAGLTLKWYRQVMGDQQVLDSLKNSLVVGVSTTLGTTLIGTSAAIALQRSRFPGQKGIALLTYVPLVMPEIVMGLSLLIWFVALHLVLGSFCVILAHITFSLSYVILTVRDRLEDFDLALEDAARDLGATSWQAFWRVTFPLIWPAVLSGGLIAFTLSFDDFLITFFTAGVGSDTLPLHIYAMIKYGVSPEIHALSSLMIFATFLLVMLFFRPEHGRSGDAG